MKRVLSLIIVIATLMSVSTNSGFGLVAFVPIGSGREQLRPRTFARAFLPRV